MSSITQNRVAVDEATSPVAPVTKQEKKGYVWHESFDNSSTYDELFGPGAIKIRIQPWLFADESMVDAPRTRGKWATLTVDEERTLFLRYNYAKYRLEDLALRQQARLSQTRARSMVEWRQAIDRTKEDLTAANMSLVIAMAKRTNVPNVDFAELISEGSMALLRAIEKFDVSKGFKFSTYACRAILKSYHRLASTTSKRVSRFGTAYDPAMERSDYDVKKHESEQERAIDDVREVLASNAANLTEMESAILSQRFALAGGKKGTLHEVGTIVGLSAERVRQIQKNALVKMHQAMASGHLAG